MQRTYQRSWAKRAIAAPAAFWVVVWLIGFFSWIGWGEYQYSRSLGNTIRQIQNDIAAIQKRSRELDIFERNFQEKSFQEKLARERFQMKKVGEHVGVIVRPEQAHHGSAPVRVYAPALNQKQNVEEWLKLLIPEREE